MAELDPQAQAAQKEARQKIEYNKAFSGDRMRQQNMANQAQAPLQQAQAADQARQARMKAGNYPNSPGQIKKGLNTSRMQTGGRNGVGADSRENKAIQALAGNNSFKSSEMKAKLGASLSSSQAAKEANKAMQALYSNGFKAMASLVGFLPILIALSYAYARSLTGEKVYKFKMWQEVVFWIIWVLVIAILLLLLFMVLYIIEYIAHPWELLDFLF